MALALAASLAAGACGDDDGAGGDLGDLTDLSDEAVVEYHYGDSSVPPEFHRSYTLTIQADEVHVVVDSYGDVLQDTTAPVPADVWSELGDAGDLAALGQLDVDDGDDGCSGGTSRSITVTDRGTTVVDTEFGVCGGANEGAAAELDGYVQPVIDSIPDWDQLLA